MTLLGKLFGSRKSDPALPAALSRGAIPHELPLGLRIGSRITFDRTMYQVAPGAMTGELPDGFQGVPCYGFINLDDGYAQHRFYTDDDAYLLVSTCAGDVEAMKAFVFVDTVNPSTKAEFQSFVMGHDHMGSPEIDYAGKRWFRATNSVDETRRIPPMAFDETLYRHSPPRKDGDLTHYAMLYSREVPELGRDEFLLVTGEDSGPNEFCITYAVGVELTIADIDIT
jgi:hypothetical protein